MVDGELVDQAVRLLSTAIGIIMEDHAEVAIEIGPTVPDRQRFDMLTQAGTDILALARAGEVLLRRREDEDV
jgi:hypothetical protein